jgi:hypothetical protein
MIRAIVLLLLAAIAGTGAWAQAPAVDPLSSSECVAARDELDKALSDPALSRQARAERLAQARQRAAVVCLGPDSGTRERTGAPQPAQVVPPPAVTVRPPPPPMPTVAAPQPPVSTPRAAAITTCDPAGCWDSEGRRLNNVGPLLMGPRGLCTMHGGLLNCP